jgi:hypothetical protein
VDKLLMKTVMGEVQPAKERCNLPSLYMLAKGEQYRRSRARVQVPATLVATGVVGVVECKGQRRSHIKRPKDDTRDFLFIVQMMREGTM